MSKKIHTIQSSNKKEFDKQVNQFLEVGGELMDGGYEVINDDDGLIYSQVIVFKNCEVEFYENYDYDIEEVSSDIQNKLFGYDLAKTGENVSLLAWLNSIKNMLHLNCESINKKIPIQCKYN